MTHDQSALLDLLAELNTADEGSVMRRILASGLQALIEAEATAAIGAGRHERTSTRTTQRNGSREKTVTTTAGDITVAIPKTRTGSFFPSLLEPRRRILLRSRDVQLPVRPVLVLAGAGGQNDLPKRGQLCRGVCVVTYRDSD